MAIDRRLRWRCRRGTREMDLILQRFVESAGGALDEEAMRSFERLLDQPDGTILDWIGRRAEPPDGALAALVDRIRDAAVAPPDKDRFLRAP